MGQPKRLECRTLRGLPAVGDLPEQEPWALISGIEVAPEVSSRGHVAPRAAPRVAPRVAPIALRTTVKSASERLRSPRRSWSPQFGADVRSKSPIKGRIGVSVASTK